MMALVPRTIIHVSNNDHFVPKETKSLCLSLILSRAERTEDHGMLASRRFGIIFCPGFVISKNRVCSVLQQLTAVA